VTLPGTHNSQTTLLLQVKSSVVNGLVQLGVMRETIIDVFAFCGSIVVMVVLSSGVEAAAVQAIVRNGDLVCDVGGVHGAHFLTESSTRGCHWLPHLRACV
jgi:hypothetical protein